MKIGPYAQGVENEILWWDMSSGGADCPDKWSAFAGMRRLTEHLERPGSRAMRTKIIKRAVASLNL